MRKLWSVARCGNVRLYKQLVWINLKFKILCHEISGKVQANKHLWKWNNSQETLISETSAHWFSVTPATVSTLVFIWTCSLSQIPIPLLKHWKFVQATRLHLMHVLAAKILRERYHNNNIDKNERCWTYHFTKFAVVAPGTLNVILIFVETTSKYLIWTSLKKSYLTDDFFKVEAPVIEWALIIVVMWEVSMNTQSLFSSLHTYQRSPNLNHHANSVGFSSYINCKCQHEKMLQKKFTHEL